MPLSLARVFLHSGAASMMFYGYQCLANLPIDAVIKTQYGGHLQYLTIQALFVSLCTATASFVADLFPFLAFLKNIKRTLLMIAMPVSVVVSVIYWPLMLFATSLILQTDPGNAIPSSSSDAPVFMRIPLHVDLALHAVPATYLLVDFMLFQTKFGRNQVTYGAPAVLALCTLSYAWWVERCASFNGGIFPYPFLTNNPLGLRIAIYIGAGTLALLSFRFLNRVHP